jgi:hypothetical protein
MIGVMINFALYLQALHVVGTGQTIVRKLRHKYGVYVKHNEESLKRQTRTLKHAP